MAATVSSCLALKIRWFGASSSTIWDQGAGAVARTPASASANLIRVWDAETGQPLYTLPGHIRVVSDIEFSLDGSRLVSASADGTARIFVLPIEELMELDHSRLTRSLTDAECQRYLHVDSCAAVP
jgi:WD40 repeat protein